MREGRPKVRFGTSQPSGMSRTHGEQGHKVARSYHHSFTTPAPAAAPHLVWLQQPRRQAQRGGLARAAAADDAHSFAAPDLEGGSPQDLLAAEGAEGGRCRWGWVGAGGHAGDTASKAPSRDALRAGLQQRAHLPKDFHTFLNSISTSASGSWQPPAAGAAAVCCAACAGPAALAATSRSCWHAARLGCCRSVLHGRGRRWSSAGGAASGAAAADRQLPASASAGRCSAAVSMLVAIPVAVKGRGAAQRHCTGCQEAEPAG